MHDKLKIYFTDLIKRIFDSSLMIISFLIGLVGHTTLILYLASKKHKATAIIEDLFTFEKRILMSCILILYFMEFLSARIKLPDQNATLMGFVVHQITGNIICFIFGVFLAGTMLFWVT